ncbi:putative Ig domain-containing protein [Prosthecobacter fusiformis]|uniref:Putative Ig domain-containing protein n=2 Tax=Prosthecobacter fusiformis TaxID=48464 RepID=A0A4R7RMH9_9BACT|nr:putative Ig domain-containing protein [Prosthecobacter fusiformis]
MNTMKCYSLIQKLKKSLSRGGSLLLLFQRTPVAQVLMPEVNFLASAAAMDTAKIVITSVIGLGAYDSVAGATTVSQVAPAAGSTTVPVTSGTNLGSVFQIIGGGGHTPQSWSVSSGTLPSGLTLTNAKGKTTTLTGTTTQTGNYPVTIRAWESTGFKGRSAQGAFTVQVSAPPSAAIVTQPSATTINSGSAATLTVTASGGIPLTYQWYRGNSGVTDFPVGTNAASYTTPVLTATTSYWVKVTNTVNPTGANSSTATVTVRQPAVITSDPAPVSINSGQSIVLTVTATGDDPLSYQWYEGASGVITTPVGENSASFTTPVLIYTTSYWVKVSNIANPTGMNSTEATVTVVPPAMPVIFTPSQLATGRTGISYRVALGAVGGTGPYAWSLSSGTLPEGLELDSTGVISGTPTVVGTSAFTVEVTDFNGDKDTEAYSVTMSDLAISTTMLPTAVKGVAYSYPLSGYGGMPAYSWKVIGGSLPGGMSFSDTGMLSGVPATVGNAPLTVRLTDGSGFSVTQQLTVPVSATFLVPVIQPFSFEPVTIGTDFSYTVSALNYPKTFVMTGLPKGLKFVAATGVISGLPDVSGVFNVQIRASNTGGTSSTVTVPLTVNALKDNLVGSFGGLVARDPVNRGLGGVLTVTTTSIGSYTVKLVGALGIKAASTSYSAKGRLVAAAPQLKVPLGGYELALTIDPDTGLMAGTLGSVKVSGWRSAWNARTHPADTLLGYYSLALDLKDAWDVGVDTVPQGSGFATFTVSSAGSLKVVGKTSDGQTITGASFLGSKGEFWIYTALYKNLGSIQGELAVHEDEGGIAAFNTIRGTVSWFKPGTVTLTYPATFGPVNLKAEGGYLALASKANILGLPDAGSVRLSFTDGGLAASDKDPDMSFTYTADHKTVLLTDAVNNPGKVTLKINAATGAVLGNFTLVEATPPLTRAKVPFVGQVVRMSDGGVKAAGYFLLHQIPVSGQTAAKAPVLSGGFKLQQPVP